MASSKGERLCRALYPDRSHRVSRSIFVLSERHSNRVEDLISITTTENVPTADSASEHPRADHQSSWKEPPGRSCAATASEASSTNTTGRLHKPPPRAPHFGAPYGANRSLGVYRSAPRPIWMTATWPFPYFEQLLARSFFRAIGDRSSDDTLQRFLWSARCRILYTCTTAT